MFMIRLLGFCMLLLIFSLGAIAQEEEKVEEAVSDQQGPGSNIYVPIKPAFVVNYGGPGKLKYMKLEVSLRVKDTPSSNAARHHMPLIRDFLVREFSRLQDADVDTQQGKENVRLSALEGIKTILKEEDGEEGIMDLFFNNFVIQR